jgi:chromosomal replication initiation ATPase DnaA
MSEKRKQIQALIANEFGVEFDFIKNKSRKTKYTYPKKVLCSVLYNKEEIVLTEVAEYMGYKDHTSVIFHIRNLEELYNQFDGFRSKVDRIFAAAYKVYCLNESI